MAQRCPCQCDSRVQSAARDGQAHDQDCACAWQVPLLPGDSEWQQLLHIFKLLGTPNEEVWPGVTKLKDWHMFPQWTPQDLNLTFPDLGAAGIDLMQRMFVYNPVKRLSVRSASLAHTTCSSCVDLDFTLATMSTGKQHQVLRILLGL